MTNHTTDTQWVADTQTMITAYSGAIAAYDAAIARAEAAERVVAAAREYHHLCQMWDNAMDARDPGALDLLDDEIPAARQRLWDTLAALTTDGAS